MSVNSTNYSNIGTEETSEENNMNGGGFYWSQNGGTDNDSKILKAASNKNIPVVEFMINNNMITNVATNDNSGKNIIHYITQDYDLYNDKQLLDKIMFNNNSKNAINNKDKNGNTPLIISVKNNNNELATQLINFGANKTIKNNEGFYVNSISSEDENNTNNFINNLTNKIGGNRNVILGERVPFNENGRRIYKNKKRYTEEAIELSRLMENQATEIHNRVKKKIKDLYKDFSDDDVSYLKATLYKMVKQKNPSLGNLDRSVEIEKNTTN